MKKMKTHPKRHDDKKMNSQHSLTKKSGGLQTTSKVATSRSHECAAQRSELAKWPIEKGDRLNGAALAAPMRACASPRSTAA